MTVGDPIRLTRRDRRVYAVALEAVRAHIAYADGWRRDPIVDVLADLTVHLNGARLYLDSRVVRARWALFLRAMLRADAGDCGATWTDLRCRYCGRIEQFDQPSTMVCDPSWPPRAGACRGILEMRRTSRVRPFTPLWQHAPKMGTAKARAR